MRGLTAVGAVILVLMCSAARAEDVDVQELRREVLKLKVKCHALELKVAELTERLDRLDGSVAKREAAAAERTADEAEAGAAAAVNAAARSVEVKAAAERSAARMAAITRAREALTSNVRIPSGAEKVSLYRAVGSLTGQAKLTWNKERTNLAGHDRTFIRGEGATLPFAEAMVSMLAPFGLTFRIDEEGQVVVGPK